MAKNLYETADETLRGEAQGSLSPEAQSLWDRYNTQYGNVLNAPMRNIRLRSGGAISIPDPGYMLKQRALSNVLKSMTATGLPTRAQPQPGLLSQFAPFVTALGSDPKFQKWLASKFGGGNPGLGAGVAESGFEVGSNVNDDWWSGMGDGAGDLASEIDWGSLGEAGYW